MNNYYCHTQLQQPYKKSLQFAWFLSRILDNRFIQVTIGDNCWMVANSICISQLITFQSLRENWRWKKEQKHSHRAAFILSIVRMWALGTSRKNATFSVSDTNFCEAWEKQATKNTLNTAIHQYIRELCIENIEIQEATSWRWTLIKTIGIF